MDADPPAQGVKIARRITGKVEGLVGYARRNFLVPIPVFESFEALNAHLLECCLRRRADCLRGHDKTVGARLEYDLAAFQTPLPAPYDACEKVATTVSSLSLVRYRRNDYSVPTTYGHRDVLVRGYVHDVVIACGAEVIARHPRSYEREDFVFEPLHYLALIEQKINALDRLHRWPTGGCRKSSPRSGVFWKPGWESRASASSRRFCG